MNSRKWIWNQGRRWGQIPFPSSLFFSALLVSFFEWQTNWLQWESAGTRIGYTWYSFIRDLEYILYFIILGGSYSHPTRRLDL